MGFVGVRAPRPSEEVVDMTKSVTRRSVATTLALLMPAALALGLASPGGPEASRAALLLSRAAYGPRPGDLDAVVAMGTDAWLERQLHPDRIDDGALDRKLDRFTELKLSTAELLAKYPRPSREEREARQKEMEAREEEMAREDGDGDLRPRNEMRRRLEEGPGRVLVQLSEAKLLRATDSERQLQEVLTDFWFNHFNVYARKNLPTLLALPSYERDAIRPRVLGTFHDLLLATAQHPAMLLYLDNWTNTREGYDPREAVRAEMERRGGREVFGRGGRRRAPGASREPERQRRKAGINENYARELLELHTLGVDGGYTQEDVVQVARAFTGWTVVDPAEVMARMRRGERAGGRQGGDGRFHFVASAHDEGPKTVLGQKITAGGIDDGLAVLRLLSRHPSTARFISTKLAERFVADAPSDELVRGMTETFLRSDGDIREVLRTMFRSPRFAEEGGKARKVKTPLELVASSLRAVGARVEGPALVRQLANMGMPLYMCQPPTGYDEEASTWLSAGSMLTRIRFAGELLAGSIGGVTVPAGDDDIEDWRSQVLGPGSHVLSPEDEATLKEALADFPDVTRSEKLQAVALVLTSPAFQRQ
jgi:uncharacterized protein (DUF1800 family)